MGKKKDVLNKNIYNHTYVFSYISLSLSVTNRDDIIANSYSLITSNGSVVDLLDAVQDLIVDLPPASLTAIEKLPAAVSKDPNYFQILQTTVNAKGSQSNTYTKDEVVAKIAAVVGAAPALLDTLVELSAALNNDPNYATTITNALATKALKNDAILTGLTTIGDLKVLTGVSTDNPLGLVLEGSGVSTLGNLTVNGSVLSTGDLTVNGTITGNAMQSNVDLKASIASMNTLQANLENSINIVSTNTYTRTAIVTKLLKQVNYEHDIDGLLSTFKLNKIQAIDYNTNQPPLIDISK